MEGTSTLLEIFRQAKWQQAAIIERPFVRHLHSDPSPAEYCRLQPRSHGIQVSVLIPTTDASRDGRFEKLLCQMDFQTLTNFEVIVIKGDPRQGRAINVGASLGKGSFLLTIDDDTALPDKAAFAKLVSALENDPAIGIAGGINTIPRDAPWLVRRAMREIPRRSTPTVSEITDSDLAEHPLLMIRRDIFERVGGENELLPRGLDPYLRQEFRKAGFRVVVVPNVFYSHLPPDSLLKLVKQFFRNGRQASYVNRHFPQWVLETPDRHGDFRLQLPPSTRAMRLPFRLIKALLTGKFVWFLCQLSYSAGFLKERWTLKTHLKSL
jgi:hypothetical protein